MRVRAVVAVLCLFALSPLLLLARQQAALPPGEIHGIVTDSSGSPVPGATVEVLLDGGFLRRVVSGRDGTFVVKGLASGTYTLAVTLAGFTPEHRTVTLGSERGLREGFTLTMGAVAEGVRLESKAMAPAAVMGGVAGGVPSPPPPARVGGNFTGMGTGQGSAGPLPGGYNRDGYAHVERNGFRLVKHEPLSTFSADVDTASYANVRRFLHEGRLPPEGAVRIEEMVNYFRFNYHAPRNEPIKLTTEVGACPWAPKHKLVLLGLKTTQVDAEDIPGRSFVFLLDVSGSMQPSDRLPLVQAGMRMFVDTLRPSDRVALVTYAGNSGVALPPTTAANRDRIHQAIRELRAGGSTNGASGIRLAYQLARDQFVKGGVNRVILATDGDFNVGVTSD